jgi:peptidyl-prolyl cis-trans isomerase B (cyclophilin B)
MSAVRTRAAAALLGALVLLVLGACTDDSGDGTSSDTTAESSSGGSALPADPAPPGPGAAITGPTPCPTTDSERTTSFAEPPPECIDPAATYTATFATTQGDVVVQLDTTLAPGGVNNFVVLSEYGYYDDTALFRTDPSIGIIQGGSPITNSPSDPGPGYTIPDEGDSFTYQPGQLVMARSAGPDSTGAQFFFTVDDNASLLDPQGNYIVLGQTDEAGLAVLQQVLDLHVAGADPTLGGGPSEEVIVESVTIEPA